MPHQVLISHATSDKALAVELRTLINRCSLQQIEAWFSSDPSSTGGLQAGTRWFEEIRTRLYTSRAIIALATRNSVSRPWLYFEAGFGAAVSELEVIPVVIGLQNVSDLPFPLAMYQAYEIKNIETASLFLRKVLSRFEVQYDQEMCEPVIHSVLPRIVELSLREEGAEKPLHRPGVGGQEVSVDRLINYMDYRFIELERSLRMRTLPATQYSIKVTFEKGGKSLENFVTIDSNASVQDVLDSIYFMIVDRAGPFKYLEEWVLVEAETETHLVIKEIQNRIPAVSIFEPGSCWQIRFLTTPYSANESAERTRRRRK
jgi:hypothetical protein